MQQKPDITDPLVYERLEKACNNQADDVAYVVNEFIKYPTEENQKELEKSCTRYRYLWMRSHSV